MAARLATVDKHILANAEESGAIPDGSVGSSRVKEQAPFGPKRAVQGRYNLNLFLGVLRRSLHGVAERPLPCNYNVIQPISTLSRRKRGFKSRRGRQFQDLGEKCLLSV
jgi:hypothetical protein